MRKPFILLLPLLLCLGCSRQKPRYVIGVSQCSADIWREKQNAELRMQTYLQENTELRFAAAYDSDERQVQQIDSLVSTGIDLLIVAPNQVQTISPAIDRAYSRGIPVIVFERKTSSKKYTAYIGADNYEMGHTMGQYIATQLGGKGRVMEIMGLRGSSPAIERHKGFSDAVARYPDIKVVATLQGDWTEQSAYEAVDAWSRQPGSEDMHIDYVFAQNDRMAMGARRAMAPLLSPLGAKPSPPPSSYQGENASHPPVRFCGIDGLPGEGGGIQLVRDSLLDATYIYPTHGDQLIHLAVSILEGKDYPKEVLLKSALVTHSNANVLLLQSEETLRQTAYLDLLHQKADNYLHDLDSQRLFTLSLAIMAVLITFTAAFVVISMRRRHRLERQAFSMVTSPANIEAHPQSQQPRAVQPLPVSEGILHPQATDPLLPSPLEASPDAPASSSVGPTDAGRAQQTSAVAQASITDVTPEQRAAIAAEADADARFLERLRSLVQQQMGDSGFGVETLASQMGVSRVQLYRKVKAQTGRTPVDIIRLSRLNRSRVLLTKESTTVSEVAYAVGFSSPSYFTKCFKEEYGMLPGDVRQQESTPHPQPR